MIKTIPQAIDDMAVSLGANPSPHIPTVSQALENVYAALGGTRTDLDTLVVSEVIDLLTPLIHSGGGGGGTTFPIFKKEDGVYVCNMTFNEIVRLIGTEGDESGLIPAEWYDEHSFNYKYWCFCSQPSPDMWSQVVAYFELPDTVTDGILGFKPSQNEPTFLWGNDNHYYPFEIH